MHLNCLFLARIHNYNYIKLQFYCIDRKKLDENSQGMTIRFFTNIIKLLEILVIWLKKWRIHLELIRIAISVSITGSLCKIQTSERL